MSRRALVTFALVAACAVPGCGTMGNLLDPSPERGRRVYGGVRFTWEAADQLLAPLDSPLPPWVPSACLLLADMPLSAIGDTLTLPYIVAYRLWWLPALAGPGEIDPGKYLHDLTPAGASAE